MQGSKGDSLDSQELKSIQTELLEDLEPLGMARDYPSVGALFRESQGVTSVAWWLALCNLERSMVPPIGRKQGRDRVGALFRSRGYLKTRVGHVVGGQAAPRQLSRLGRLTALPFQTPIPPPICEPVSQVHSVTKCLPSS